MTNLERYKNDLEKLIKTGSDLQNAMQYETFPTQMSKHVNEKFGDKAIEILKNLPNFKDEYQNWYSESLVLIRQLLPDRLNDFISLYEKPEARKVLQCDSYVIQDYLNGLRSS